MIPTTLGRRVLQRLMTASFCVAVVTATVQPAPAQEETTNPSPAPAAQVPQSSPSDASYEFGVGDVIQLQVWGRPELSGLVPVDPAGKVQAPLLGAVEVEGRTPADLTEELTQRYQLLDPSITEVLVSVAQYNSRTVAILGEVKSPGTYGFRQLPDLWDALLTAGGATTQAALGRVQIVRGQRRLDEPRTVTVDLTRGIERTPAESLPELRPRDTIVVPAIESGVPEGDAFHVLGQVGAPGSYSMFLADDVVEALALVGGANPTADLRSVRLLRHTADGSISYEFDLEGFLYEADPPVDLALRPGDVITVPARQTLVGRVSELLAPFVSVAGIIVLINRANVR